MPTRRAVIVALMSAGLGVACRRAVGGSGRADVDALAERYVRLTLQLAQHQPLLVEIYLGPDSLRPGPRVPVSNIRPAIDELEREAAALAVAMRGRDHDRFARVQYLVGQAHALQTAARRLAGERMRFADEARNAMGIERSGRVPRDGAAARKDLDARLPGPGSLADRYAAFRHRHQVPADRILAVFRAAADACRGRVQRQLPLPEGEHVEIAELAGAGLEAQATYAGSFRTRVAIATSGPLDLAHLVWLAAHETYPGHHLQHVLADRHSVRESGWIERTLHPGFGPHVLIAEGAAETGAALLLESEAFAEICQSLAAEASTPAPVIPEMIAVHRAMTELDEVVAAVAQAYLDSELGSEAATGRLREEALVPNPSQLLAVIERERTRILAYPEGRRLVSAHVMAGPDAGRWARLAAIATTLTVDRAAT